MHGNLASNAALLQALLAEVRASDAADAAVCVPFPYLAQTRELLQGSAIAWGAQNLSDHAQGAYTGEVSGAMIAEFGCHYVIVGHSERRTLYAETDALVASKFMAAQKAGLIPILCVGETLNDRDTGYTAQVVTAQIETVLDAAGVTAFESAVVAYEPVWAIGTGRTATPQQAQEVHALIRARVAVRDPVIADKLRILYGGSVKPQNAAELFAMRDIDGGLIGGASLVAKDFLGIIRAA